VDSCAGLPRRRRDDGLGNGWHDSFMIFVVSFYVFPMFYAWDLAVRSFFLPKNFEPAPSKFQTLGLNSE